MKKAFSLIELLVVVAIIFVLAAIIIPPCADMSNQKQSEVVDNNGRFYISQVSFIYGIYFIKDSVTQKEILMNNKGGFIDVTPEDKK